MSSSNSNLSPSSDESPSPAQAPVAPDGVPAAVPTRGTTGIGVTMVALSILGPLLVLAAISSIAIPNFVAQQRIAHRAELGTTVNAIRTAEFVYFRAHGEYLPVSSRGAARAARTERKQRKWPGGADWEALGWYPAGVVHGGAYWVEVVAGGFVAHGISDLDGDGVYAEYEGTDQAAARQLTPDTTY